MSGKDQTAIMTPVFEGTRYLHHVCSECNGTLKFEQSCFGDVSFYDITLGECKHIKFCPLCGCEVVRFAAEPIYKEPLDLKLLDIFAELKFEYERKADWLYHYHISDKHREQVTALEALVDSREIPGYYKNALEVLHSRSHSLSAQRIRKLKKEFGEDKE